MEEVDQAGRTPATHFIQSVGRFFALRGEKRPAEEEKDHAADEKERSRMSY